MKMYVLVRNDISPSYSAVQGGHALAQYLLEYPAGVRREWHNGTLIYLAVKDENALIGWASTLSELSIDYSEFVEPDIGDEVTALAALDYPDRRLEKLFRDLPLL